MAYSKGLITIPNVTGNIEIVVKTEEAAINPIELYTGNASDYQINKKYSGTSIVDGAGYYLTDIVPVDFTVRLYLNIDGARNGSNGSYPFLYKIGLYKGGIINNVEYLSNLTPDAGTSMQHSIDLSKYSQCDGIQLLLQVSDSAITETNVLTTSQFSAKISVEPLY